MVLLQQVRESAVKCAEAANSHTSNINIYCESLLATGGAFTATAPFNPQALAGIPRMEITF